MPRKHILLSPLTDPDATPAMKIIYYLGGARPVAQALSVSPQTVWKWARIGRIPAEQVIPLETLSTGYLTRHQLRPDLYPQDSL